jgi:hypothetical protein
MISRSCHSTPKSQRNLKHTKAHSAWYGGEAENLEEMIVKQENALVMHERTIVGSVIVR